MKYARIIKTSLFAFGLTSASVMAATQGTLGTSSTGSLIVQLDIANLVQVSNLDDINLGTYSGSGNLTGNDGFCVYRNAASGAYRITMNGSGALSAYTLTDGTNILPYTVSYTDPISGANPMTATSPLSGQTGAHTTLANCGGVDIVNVAVTVDNTDLAAAPAGTYTGTLTMVVAPE